MIQRTCVNHPDRRAIGVCVMTGKAICNECSTRYEGVNYSKEGLEMLKAQRGGETARGPSSAAVLAWLVSPALAAALFGFFWYAFVLLIDLQQLQFSN
jgi:hypothetical protein